MDGVMDTIESVSNLTSDLVTNAHSMTGVTNPVGKDTDAASNAANVIEETKNDHRVFCRLGRRDYNVSDEAMSGLPAFTDLLDPHREVHRKDRDVLLSLMKDREAA
jgi:hypothetical protein